MKHWDIMDEPDDSGFTSIEWQELLKDYHINKNYICGYVTNKEDVSSILELHRRVTATTFSIRHSTSLQFNPNQIDREKTKFTFRSIFFSKSSPRITSDGVPFIFGGLKHLECQFGPRREHAKKQDGILIQQRDAPTFTSTGEKMNQTQTRKKGCEARISVKQICRFPDYELISKKNLQREQVKLKERLLQDLAQGKQLAVEHRFYLELPLNAAHTKHALDSLSSMVQPIHPQISQWIDELVSEGVTSAVEVQASLKHYVKMRMVDTVAPSELDRGYYPRLGVIRNHIYKAKVRQRMSKLCRKNGVTTIMKDSDRKVDQHTDMIDTNEDCPTSGDEAHSHVAVQLLNEANICEDDGAEGDFIVVVI
ncbi:calcium-responsive transcription factor-like isoform X2 [Thalassophryne amazonica]|uniref:calcium-responsive transcription factor-like isoform X2 n=1 Tax=Thalassophryne amazonica TaxID=390379 RepID=UPI001471BB35|nr:calcium-responsive transcription factor-like isoform X2 [Thalassophryne amazonica]